MGVCGQALGLGIVHRKEGRKSVKHCKKSELTWERLHHAQHHLSLEQCLGERRVADEHGARLGDTDNIKMGGVQR